jgi:hypothetical protein
MCIHFGGIKRFFAEFASENLRKCDSSRLTASMSSNNMEGILQRPLIYPTCEELRPVSADPCQYLKSEDPNTRDGEISKSGWTIYFDDYVDSCGHKNTTSQFDVDQQ